MKLRFALTVLAAACATPALGADANAGKQLFRGQCALCHSAEPNDNGGAQGLSLQGVFGRAAATASGFGYTQALKDSHLTWDAATLDRFLNSPTTVVPGSAMVIPVPKKDDRDNIVAYFSALKDGTFKEATPQRRGPPPGMGPNPNAGPPKGEADWKKDAPAPAQDRRGEAACAVRYTVRRISRSSSTSPRAHPSRCRLASRSRPLQRASPVRARWCSVEW